MEILSMVSVIEREDFDISNIAVDSSLGVLIMASAVAKVGIMTKRCYKEMDDESEIRISNSADNSSRRRCADSSLFSEKEVAEYPDNSTIMKLYKTTIVSPMKQSRSEDSAVSENQDQEESSSDNQFFDKPRSLNYLYDFDTKPPLTDKEDMESEMAPHYSSLNVVEADGSDSVHSLATTTSVDGDEFLYPANTQSTAHFSQDTEFSEKRDNIYASSMPIYSEEMEHLDTTLRELPPKVESNQTQYQSISSSSYDMNVKINVPHLSNMVPISQDNIISATIAKAETKCSAFPLCSPSTVLQVVKKEDKGALYAINKSEESYSNGSSESIRCQNSIRSTGVHSQSAASLMRTHWLGIISKREQMIQSMQSLDYKIPREDLLKYISESFKEIQTFYRPSGRSEYLQPRIVSFAIDTVLLYERIDNSNVTEIIRIYPDFLTRVIRPFISKPRSMTPNSRGWNQCKRMLLTTFAALTDFRYVVTALRTIHKITTRFLILNGRHFDENGEMRSHVSKQFVTFGMRQLGELTAKLQAHLETVVVKDTFFLPGRENGKLSI